MTSNSSRRSTARSRAAFAAAASAALALGLAACSSGDEQAGPAAQTTQTGETERSSATAAERTDVVATTQVWADVAGAVLDREVGAVISNSSTDPHDYEPTAADHARINSADLVIANGGAYDAALYSTADASKVVSALPLAKGHETHDHGAEAHEEHEGHEDHEGHDHGGMIEHIWYSTEAVSEVGHKIADAKGGDAAKLDARLDEISAAIEQLPGARVAQVHPIADALIEDSPLELATPEAYRDATVNEQEPSTAAVAEFIDAIRAGDIDLVISNPQSPNASAQRILDEAKAKNIPVVEVTETPPNGENFLDYFAGVVDSIGKALR